MTTLNISIRLDNSAFEDDGLISELHHVMSAIQFKIAQGQTKNQVYDTNGNNVANFEIVED
jgi:hypothetical protein